ncbi:threonine synthase [bacterium]|nr:threonine synthase [bacterium]
MGKLICSHCQKEYSDVTLAWKCECGGFFDLPFTPRFPLSLISSRKPDMWRYREALPISSWEQRVSFGEGYTPLSSLSWRGHQLLVKQDHLFPTGSFKDRGASFMVSKLRELGILEVIEDSSGNAGSAMAAYCAKAGIKCHIYVPESTSPAKLTQIAAYGAILHKIPGSREDTARAAHEAANSIYYASHIYSPYFLQGIKTISFEIVEQLSWRAPRAIILPVGNGSLLLGCYLGFRELQEAGIIDSIPRMFGVQALNCAPIFHAYKQGLQQPVRIETKPTLAEGIAIKEPARGKQILQAIRDSHGEIRAVSETEITEAMLELARSGYYLEPSSAAPFAALPKLSGYFLKSEEVVAVITGHGLKATDKFQQI